MTIVPWVVLQRRTNKLMFDFRTGQTPAERERMYVSSLLFNGNPLLRYDGYYILTDVLEIPNLWQRAARYWGYLVERYVFHSDEVREFPSAEGERFWLFLYGPASFLYRVAVMLGIAIFISDARSARCAAEMWW